MQGQGGAMAVVCGAVLAYQTLSLNFQRFEVKSTVNNNVLSWQTSDEVNVDHFDIEKAVAADNFGTIGQVVDDNGQRNQHVYAFTDKRVMGAISHYRLKAVDKDGKFIYSAVVSINSNGRSANVVTCTPNPFSEYFLLNTNFSTSTIVRLSFYTLQGNMVSTRQVKVAGGFQPTTIIDLKGIPKEIRIITVTTSDNSYCQRVIKE